MLTACDILTEKSIKECNYFLTSHNLRRLIITLDCKISISILTEITKSFSTEENFEVLMTMLYLRKIKLESIKKKYARYNFQTVDLKYKKMIIVPSYKCLGFALNFFPNKVW